MPNRLAQETSPYLLQHAHNPVDWFPWNAEALETARREDKPIFLSIGYAACHWCHVMAHESFEDPEIAAILNRDFVPIKVDREERPDLDQIYMNAVVAMTGQGGWPMSIFLTPDGKPFYGGTYFPPNPRYGMPSFRQVLESLAQTWKTDREQADKVGDQLTGHLQKLVSIDNRQQPVQEVVLETATQELLSSYDRENGGWGSAPKFPQPMAIEFLLRQVTRGNEPALETALHALRTMSRGGMYDVVGGGFHRYSTDERWLVPHFEKMLYDNALLARVYLYAHLITRNKYYRQVAEETLDFVLREMTHPEGGYYSSLDADSEGEEGKYYVWTLPEIETALQDPHEVDFLRFAYGLTGIGNFEGKWILQRAHSDDVLAEHFDMDSDQVPDRLKTLHTRLMESRDKRIRPGTDDKILVSWNSWMLRAFAEAARYLNRRDYLEAARKNAAFLLEKLHPLNRLLRTWRDGKAGLNAYLEDYASFILGLLALYEADPNPRWFSVANQLTEEMIDNYRDPGRGFFDTRADHDPLIVRPKDTQDNATPSGNALASHALLVLAALAENGEWVDTAEEMLGTIQSTAARYPTAFSYWLNSLDFAIGPVKQVAIIGPLDYGDTQALQDIYNSAYLPRSVLAVSDYPPPPKSPPLLAGRTLIHGISAAYVCENFICRLPVTEPASFRQQLGIEPAG